MTRSTRRTKRTPLYCQECRRLVLAAYRANGEAYCEEHAPAGWRDYSTPGEESRAD